MTFARLPQLNRLQGRSLAEVGERGRQGWSKLRDRLLYAASEEMGDRAFQHALNARARRSSAIESASAIHERIRRLGRPSEYERPVFFESIRSTDEIAEAMERRFPAERAALLTRADNAAEGRFQLLGLPEVDFGSSISWRLEPLSGKRTHLQHWSRIDYLNPAVAGDKKVTWELNRHGHFVTLGQAYCLTGDERYSSAFAHQINSWISGNPRGRGINWASSLEVAFRAIAWLWSLHLLAGSSHLTTPLMLRVLKSLVSHGCHIETYLSRYFSPNTHLTGEALGLFYLGTALPEFRRARSWQETGLQILLEQLPVQVGSDGVYFERATYYHRYTVDFYLHLAILAEACGVALPKDVREKLSRMLDHLMWITRPDGSSPLIGDDDGGRLVAFGTRTVDDFRDTLAVGAALFGRHDWKHVTGNAPPELLWMLGPPGLASYDEIGNQEPEWESRAFNEGGVYVMRDGWSAEATSAVVNCGKHGALTGAHAHSDALAFDFAAQGKTWLIDPGTFTYTMDPHARDDFRITGAHNTVTVDGESQSLPDGPFRWACTTDSRTIEFVEAGGFCYFEGAHDGYHRLSDPVSHRRSLFLVKSSHETNSCASTSVGAYLVVRDSFSARSAHEYSLHYHLQPPSFAAAQGNRVTAADSGGRRLNISVFSTRAVTARLVERWVSKGYQHRQRGLTALFESVAAGPVEFITFIVPDDRTSIASVQEESCSFKKSSGFVVSRKDAFDVVMSGDGRRARCGPLLASGRWAWARFAGNRLSRGVLIKGTRLETTDGYTLTCSEDVVQSSIECSEELVELAVTTETKTDGSAGTLAIKGSRFEFPAGVHRITPVSNGSGWRLTSTG